MVKFNDIRLGTHDMGMLMTLAPPHPTFHEEIVDTLTLQAENRRVRISRAMEQTMLPRPRFVWTKELITAGCALTDRLRRAPEDLEAEELTDELDNLDAIDEIIVNNDRDDGDDNVLLGLWLGTRRVS